ncbi:MAG: DMT family transporter [Deltaproteobacteria bacterium]|nr:DMT family transporter [Deltaproteobacteria bacterium]
MSRAKLAGLIFCNLLWSGAYSTSKELMKHYSPMELSLLRYLSAGLPLMLYCVLTGPERQKQIRRRSYLGAWLRDLQRLDGRLLLVGLLTFFVSPYCQMTGVHLSRAIDSSLMIALEPLVTIFAACLMLGERLRAVQFISLGLAVCGAGILTDVTWAKLISFSDPRMVGNSIFLISTLSESAYSTIAKPVLNRRSPVVFLTVAIWVGIALIFTHNLLVDGPARLGGIIPLLQRGQWTDWAAILYLGPGCTLFAYLFWMIVMIDTPVSIMAVTLYVQPVLGVVWGYFFLGEAVTLSTFLGGVLLLTAVWLGSRPRRG